MENIKSRTIKMVQMFRNKNVEGKNKEKEKNEELSMTKENSKENNESKKNKEHIEDLMTINDEQLLNLADQMVVTLEQPPYLNEIIVEELNLNKDISMNKEYPFQSDTEVHDSSYSPETKSSNLEEYLETHTKKKCNRLTKVIPKKKNKSKLLMKQNVIREEKTDKINLAGGEDSRVNETVAKKITKEPNNKTNTDFVDEAELNTQTSTAYSSICPESREIYVVGENGKRKPKRLNQRNIAKQLRAEGKQYCSSKKRIIPARSLQPVPCKSCQHNCTIKFSAEERQEIFDQFWKLANSQQQNSFLLSSVSIESKKRKYTKKNESRRTNKNLHFTKK